MFGSEQAYAQQRPILKAIYNLIGEFRYPIRLRGFYLSRALPSGCAPASIWDAGCGEGQTSFYLTRRFPKAALLGTDITQTAIERCQTIAQMSRAERATFETSDLVRSAPPSGRDLITCFEVLEHISDFPAALSNLAGALNPDGILVIHTPAAGKYTETRIGLRRWRIPDQPSGSLAYGQYHVRPGYRLDELCRELEARGLSVEIARFTFGPAAMFAHTIYEVTRPRTILKLLTFPFLIVIGWLDWHLVHTDGGGLLIRARKLAK